MNRFSKYSLRRCNYGIIRYIWKYNWEKTKKSFAQAELKPGEGTTASEGEVTKVQQQSSS